MQSTRSLELEIRRTRLVGTWHWHGTKRGPGRSRKDSRHAGGALTARARIKRRLRRRRRNAARRADA